MYFFIWPHHGTTASIDLSIDAIRIIAFRTVKPHGHASVMSHQQLSLRPYGDGAMSSVSAADLTGDPWVHGKWFNHYTMVPTTTYIWFHTEAQVGTC